MRPRNIILSILSALSVIGFFLSISVAQVSSSGSSTGSVEGIVLDGDGKPLAGANVWAMAETDMRRQYSTESNDAGEFTLPGLPEGVIYLSAFKENDGYPYNFFSFFVSPGENIPIKLQIEADQEIKDVRIRLGERAARLNLEITTEDGESLEKGVSLTFTRPDQPDRPYMHGARPSESVLVPPVPFHISVSDNAKAHEIWHYGGDKTGLLTLKPGETFDLTVRLEKLP